MILLTATNQTLELETSTTAAIDYTVSWMDHTTTAGTPGASEGAITTATTTTITAAPGSSTQRQIRSIRASNKSTTTANVLTLNKDVAATEYRIARMSIGPGESMVVDCEGRISVVDSSGRLRTQATDVAGYTGRAYEFFKTGTAAEAVGVRYWFGKDAGLPGAWAPGTPGAAGRTTDGTTATDAGCIPFQNASSGSLYLTGMEGNASVTGTLELWDVLWVNSGLVVTTTTAQTVNSLAWPARDVNGSTNGEGVNIAILATAATTNAGAVTNTTMSYTDSDGNAGATATMPSTIPGGGWPATAVIGTVQPFYLAAGDRGVRSVQSVTLGTSYAGGSISLIAYRKIASVSCNTASVPFDALIGAPPGVRLYSGSCLLLVRIPSATTATNVAGGITIMER